jgi:methyl-accepting chemotaxis protein
MMDIACDVCGKRYRIDETKMKSEKARTKCKSCSHIITVIRPPSANLQKPHVDVGLEAPAEAPPPPTGVSRAREADSDLGAGTARVAETFAGEPAAETKDLQAPTGFVKVRFGLFYKILFLMLIIGIVPFAVFWFITFQQTSDRLRTDSEAILAQTAKGLADQMDGWINANFAVLRTAAKLPGILSMNPEQQEPILKAIGREYPWMYLVFTVNPAGMNIARSDDQPVVSYADRQYFKDIMAGKAIGWQSVVGRTSKVPALVIAVPIKEHNRTIGVMAAAMTVEELSRHIATWKKGATGFAFLVDEKNNVVSHPQRQLVAKRESLSSHPLIAQFRKRGWTTFTTSFTDEGGQRALGHARTNNYGWILAVQQEEREVFDSLNLLQNFALTLLAITVLLAASIAWFAARGIVRPIMKLTDAAERMSLGDLNVKINVPSRDEIGLLAQAIARMQTSLRISMERLRRKR